MNDAFEQVYRDAREVLYHRGMEVGKPVCANGGLRYCPIDGSLLSDQELLREAWGADLADELLSERASCRKCDGLWIDYSELTMQYVRIIRQRESAAPHGTATLDSAERRAAARRHEARTALLDHAATHRNEQLH